MQKFKNLLNLSHLNLKITTKRSYCNAELVKKESVEKGIDIFLKEQKRQLEEIGRIEKISVDVINKLENFNLVMNKNISTPYECCKHISQALCNQYPLALVNEKLLWDMHRPLPENCTLQFLSFNDPDPFNVNKAFWRTGSFILGAVVSKAFKDNITVHLHSFPPPYIKSGSFVYDVYMNLSDWTPTPNELKVLSSEFIKFVNKNHKIERLRVKKSVAAEIFQDNPYKTNQLSKIATNDKDNLVTLYKVDDHIDISSGPMIANTSFFGRSSVTAVYKILPEEYMLYRFQGVALPKGILLNSYAYGIIQERGAVLNEATPNVSDDIRKDYENQKPLFPLSQTKLSADPLSIEGHL